MPDYPARQLVLGLPDVIWADRPELRAARVTAAMVDGLTAAQLADDDGRVDGDVDTQRGRATSEHVGP